MTDLEKIYEILLKDNIDDYKDEIFKIIPELKYEDGFMQNNPWHDKDVWHHTLKVINACDKNKEDRLILLLHDIGKPFSYQDDENGIRHFKGHALKSSEIAKDILNRLNVLNKDIMLELIKDHATRIDLNNVNNDNLYYYERLIKLQMCDAYGYEIEHSRKILNELSNICLELYEKGEKQNEIYSR